MKLELVDFEASLDAKLVGRGRGYWVDGRVDTPEESEDSDWVAFVQGGEAHEVHISLSGGQTTRYRCTCPYDLGPVCKHIVAMLYALRDRLPEYAPEDPAPSTEKDQGAPQRSGTARRKRKTVADRIDEALDAVPLERTRELYRRLAVDHPEARVLLFAEVAGKDKTSTKTDYKRIVRESVRGARGRRGFIDYRGSFQAAKGAEEALTQADALLADGRADRAVSACQAVIEELVPVLARVDDSSGAIGGCVQAAFERFEECVTQIADARLREDLFHYCLKESRRGKYRDWHWRWDFLRLSGMFVASSVEMDDLFLELDLVAQVDADRGFTSRHSDERAAEIKLGVLRRQADVAVVEAFLAEHLHLPAIRHTAVTRAFEEQRFDAVKQLARDGVRQAKEDGHRGLGRDWVEWLLRVAIEVSDTNAVREHAQDLFLTGGRVAHYETLKNSYPASEWTEQVDRIICGMRKTHGWYPHGVVSQFLILEERWDDLLDLVRHAPTFEVLDAHREYLEPRFPPAMVDIYSHTVREMLTETSERETYRRACQLLRRIRSLGDHARVDDLIEEFRERYKRRRALMEELDAV